MEPDRQIEIQLGHMCNNRCVFCVSGQRTAMREAFPIASDPVLERLREARASGITKVTLLGGEPTIQPEFLRVVRGAVDLAFEEIVVFTNGVKTARASFVDELLATGGNFTFRLSFQGGDERAHDRTTKKLGSFLRLVDTLENLRARKQRITVNMCVVRSNYESVAAFPALLLPFGVRQLHLDMVRPLDAGVRSDEELQAMMPRHSDLVPALERMVAGFPEGFDVNIGNLPFCVAPTLAHVIHHDGTDTLTVAVDGDDALSEPWDKYETKRRDKVKPESCRQCLFDDRCSGVYDTYRRFHGTSELVPVTRERLRVLDPARRSFTLHAAPCVDALRARGAKVHVDSHAQRVSARFDDGLEIMLAPPGGGAASSDAFSLHVIRGSAPIDELFADLVAAADARVHHAPAGDALFHGPQRARSEIDPRIGECLARLRAHAPYGELAWAGADVGRDRASVDLRHGDVTVTLAFAVHGRGVQGGYRLDRVIEAPPPALIDGVRRAMTALRGVQPAK